MGLIVDISTNFKVKWHKNYAKYKKSGQSNLGIVP